MRREGYSRSPHFLFAMIPQNQGQGDKFIDSNAMPTQAANIVLHCFLKMFYGIFRIPLYCLSIKRYSD